MVNFTAPITVEEGDTIGDQRDLGNAYEVDEPTYEEYSQEYDEDDVKEGLEPVPTVTYEEDEEYLSQPESGYKTYYQETYRYPDSSKTVNVSYGVEPKYPDVSRRLRNIAYYEDDPRYPVRSRYVNRSFEANKNKYPPLSDGEEVSQRPPSSQGRPQSPSTDSEQGAAIPMPDIPGPRPDPRREEAKALAPQMQQMQHIQQMQQMQHMQQMPPKRSVDMRDPTKLEALKKAHESVLRDLEEAGMNLGPEVGVLETAGADKYNVSPFQRAGSPRGQRKMQSPLTMRPSTSPASRPSSMSRPATPRGPAIRPASAASSRGDALDAASKRNLYLKYSYIPAWIFLARRNEKFFRQVLDYYFNHIAWPDFEKLPESFRSLCSQNNIGRNHAKKMPGFAPMWLFVLKKMDKRYFMAAVDHFFEHKVFPNWDWLPENFVLKFQELGLHERQYYA